MPNMTVAHSGIPNGCILSDAKHSAYNLKLNGNHTDQAISPPHALTYLYSMKEDITYQAIHPKITGIINTVNNTKFINVTHLVFI